MKKIAVVGLGIIGGSVSAALSAAGYSVDGSDLNAFFVDYALQKGYIQAECNDLSEYDVVFIAVPPSATQKLLRETPFKEGAFVADICGVKTAMQAAADENPSSFRYIGLHPMAGKETSGISSASSTLFKNANLVIATRPQTDEKTLAEAKEYASAMGFSNIVECSAETHDQKIALTSQLAHIVSNAYVKSPQVKDCHGFTGGSFQDMTRIAGVDEKLWTELYFCNKDNLLTELENLCARLTDYASALKAGDEAKLSELLKEGRLIRETIRRPND